MLDSETVLICGVSCLGAVLVAAAWIMLGRRRGSRAPGWRRKKQLLLAAPAPVRAPAPTFTLPEEDSDVHILPLGVFDEPETPPPDDKP